MQTKISLDAINEIKHIDSRGNNKANKLIHNNKLIYAAIQDAVTIPNCFGFKALTNSYSAATHKISKTTAETIEAKQDDLAEIVATYFYTATDANSQGITLPLSISHKQAAIMLGNYSYAFNFTNNTEYDILKDINTNQFVNCKYVNASKQLEFNSEYARDVGSYLEFNKNKLTQYARRIYFDETKITIDGYTPTSSVIADRTGSFACQCFKKNGVLSQWLFGNSATEESVISKSNSSANQASYAYYGDKIVFKILTSSSLCMNVEHEFKATHIKAIFNDGTVQSIALIKTGTSSSSHTISGQTCNETWDNYEIDLIKENFSAIDQDKYVISISFDCTTTGYKNLIFTLSNNTYKVKAKDTSISGNITIPSTYNGKNVTIIEASGFKGCKQILSISIPDTVTSIENEAFQNCIKLKSINIPEGVTRITHCSFDNCNKLESITIPKGVTMIYQYAFRKCYGLKSISVQSGNSYYYSEGNCLIRTSTKELVLGCNASQIPNGLRGIYEYAFYGCKDFNQNGQLDLSDVKEIGDYAFYGCQSLTSGGDDLCLDHIQSIGAYAFAYCYKLGTSSCGYGELPFGNTSDLMNIGTYAFTECISLTQINMPENIETLSDSVFEGCTNLKNVYFASAIKKIGRRAFGGCNNLILASFADPNNWIASGSGNTSEGTTLSSSSMSNTSTAATYLKSTYVDRYFVKYA